MRLIDADALAERLGINSECKDCQYYDKSLHGCVRYDDYFTDVCEAIYDAPTIHPEPSEIARDIATILENEQDMRVILKNAQPKRMRGRWIPVTNGRGGFECDQCHNYAPSYQDGVEWLSDFCPSCGARMDGGEA